MVFLLCGLTSSATAQQLSVKRLTLKEAIDLALRNNLGVLLARSQIGEAEGTTERQFSALLPRVNGGAQASLQNRNLQVAGISFPGVPSTVPPYAFYDFRVTGSQPLIDRQAWHGWKASTQQEHSARLSYQDTRELVVRQAAGLYFASEAAAARVQAAESRVTTSEALEKLARDRRSQGLATGVDVVRAQVQLARDQQNLLVAQNAYQTSLLSLAHFLGLAPGTPLEPAEQLQFHPVEIPAPEQAFNAALAARSDYRALVAQREALVERQKATRARYLPRLGVTADYGEIGRTFGSMTATGTLAGNLSITLFDRDRKGERDQLSSRMAGLNAQIDDLARTIDQDVRQAILDLRSTEEQVKVTDAVLNLSRRELELAQDRFKNGLGDNVEVVTAQDAVAGAQNESIAALARHADAGMALARALGAPETSYQMYMGKP
ncbi:MAG: TolC family protein [Acidobacteriia bacterium]|nr:TolC family protein [Terriglobia bacterium]